MSLTKKKEDKQMRKHGVFLLKMSGTFFIIFIGYIIFSANKGSIPPFIRQIYMFPGGDKLGHIFLFGLLSLFVNYFLYPRHIHVLGKSVLMGTLILLCLITVEELSQLLIAMRSFDVLDLCSSYIGILAGDVSMRHMNKRQIEDLSTG